MADYNTTAAFFPSQASAESAIDSLKAAGFDRSQIGVAAATSPAGNTGNTAYAAGHSAGTAWENVKSFFSGDSAEPYAGERTNETFNDNVVTPDYAYQHEDLHGSLSNLSVPEDHSRYFSHRLGQGEEGAILTVTAPGREEEALEMLEAAGGDIGDDATEFDYGAGSPAQGVQNIQLYGEVLRVHKDRVQSGEVRIRKEVTTTTQTVEVPVTREELVVERVPVSADRPAPEATFQNQQIRIPLSEEKAIVTKDVVIREEVRIGKKEVTNVESHDAEVRNEDLKVDNDLTERVSKTA